ncbi:MAG: porin [Myxococcaceae bacterium]|nr:porin [Myxococcaceae bacterium]
MAPGLVLLAVVVADGGEPHTLEELAARVERLEAELAATRAGAPDAGMPLGEPVEAPLDLREPPFSKSDWSWLNGSNYQPPSLLRIGPVTPTFFVDADYAWQFWNPVDHTIFPTTTAARHGEFNLNLAYLGFELNGLDTKWGAPIGRFEVQFGSYIATIHGQDNTLTRGSFLSNPTLSYVKQAGVGWHFHALHGINVELGIFPSYIALESFVPQENWNYTHPFVSDFTPYYLAGLRTQIFPAESLKVELWLVNGWQSFGRWHDALTGGYLINWRPNARLSLTHNFYAGQEQTRASDPSSNSLRVFTDNYAQLLVFDDLGRAVLQRLAFCLVADFGYEYRGPNVVLPPNGPMFGASLTMRVEWTRQVMSTLRADVFYDASSAVVMALPLGNPYTLPGRSGAANPYEFLGGGGTVTLDWRPSPWLLVRAEYMHRRANQPYFSGPGGITGPNGLPPKTDAERATFTPDLRHYDNRVVVSVTLRM